jgi:transcriptional regulator with XRE-family HTH domain
MATTKNNKSDFSSRLRSLRGERTQGDFAEFLGFSSQQTYQNYERGRIPKPAVLQQIAQRTGVSMIWLMTGEQPHEDPPRASVVNDSLPSPAPVTNYSASFHRLAETADLPWLLDRLEILSKDAAAGDRLAAQTMTDLIPIIRKRIESPS